MLKPDLLDKLFFYLSVPTCVSCKEKLSIDDLALCPKCYAEYEKIATRNCSVCSKVLSECTCSNDYLEKHFVKRLVKVFRYNQRPENLAANSIIYSLKRDNRKDVLKLCTHLLVGAIKSALGECDDYLITNVPRRRSAILQYGMDHSALLAKSVAKALGAEYRSILKSKAKKAQKNLRGDERVANIEFKIKKSIDLKRRKVIIVDDVVTSGTSMGVAASLIRSLGARNITGAALAIAFKDKYAPPIFTFN